MSVRPWVCRVGVGVSRGCRETANDTCPTRQVPAPPNNPPQPNPTPPPTRRHRHASPPNEGSPAPARTSRAPTPSPTDADSIPPPYSGDPLRSCMARPVIIATGGEDPAAFERLQSQLAERYARHYET